MERMGLSREKDNDGTTDSSPANGDVTAPVRAARGGGPQAAGRTAYGGAGGVADGDARVQGRGTRAQAALGLEGRGWKRPGRWR